MIDEINSQAFDLIKLVSSKSKEKSYHTEELKGSVKEKGSHDWSDKLVGGLIERTTDSSDNTLDIFSISDKGTFGFDEINYPKYKSLIEKIYSLQEFKSTVAEGFIENKLLTWVLDIYLNQKAGVSLIDYLRSEVESNINNFQFHFPILNLEIEESFKIGNVDFTFFTKEYLDNLYKSLQCAPVPMDEKNFSDTYRKNYQGQVLAKVTVKAEQEKAEDIAMNEAELSVDVLKIYGLTPTIPENRTMFDLNYRLNYQMNSNYLSEKIGKKDSLSETLNCNNPPFIVTSQQLAFANNNGLPIFSNFITLKKNDELYNLIVQGIGLFASSISNWNLHLRIINLITILESLLLKDEEDYKMERKVKDRLSQIITNEFQEQEKLKIIFSNIYKIRHKMVHKAIKLPINTRELMTAQVTIINLLLNLMRFNVVKKYTNKNDLIDTLK